MIDIFCHWHHDRKEGLCPECRELLDYVTERLEKCPLKKNKPKCSKCPVHCYKLEKRKKIRAVMKYSGPRIAVSTPDSVVQTLPDREVIDNHLNYLL